MEGKISAIVDVIAYGSRRATDDPDQRVDQQTEDTAGVQQRTDQHAEADQQTDLGHDLAEARW